VRPQLNVLVAAALAALIPASAVGGVSPSATIVGTVTLTAANGDSFPGEGARVTLGCAADATTRTEVSDEHGAFRFSNVPVDTCAINADVQGFVAAPVRVVTAADQVVGSDLHLGIAALRVGVNAGGTVPLQERRVRHRSCRSEGSRWASRRSGLRRGQHRRHPECGQSPSNPTAVSPAFYSASSLRFGPWTIRCLAAGGCSGAHPLFPVGAAEYRLKCPPRSSS
jgi:hypothetical protein